VATMLLSGPVALMTGQPGSPAPFERFRRCGGRAACHQPQRWSRTCFHRLLSQTRPKLRWRLALADRAHGGAGARRAMDRPAGAPWCGPAKPRMWVAWPHCLRGSTPAVTFGHPCARLSNRLGLEQSRASRARIEPELIEACCPSRSGRTSRFRMIFHGRAVCNARKPPATAPPRTTSPQPSRARPRGRTDTIPEPALKPHGEEVGLFRCAMFKRIKKSLARFRRLSAPPDGALRPPRPDGAPIEVHRQDSRACPATAPPTGCVTAARHCKPVGYYRDSGSVRNQLRGDGSQGLAASASPNPAGEPIRLATTPA